MTIACVAGAERGGRVGIIRERERKGGGAPTSRPLFQPYFTFAKIMIGQNYLHDNQGPNRTP